MKVVGISQKIRRPWLDFALDRLAQTRDEKQLRSMLDAHLREDLPGTESRAKAAGIVLRIWATVRPKHESYRDRAVALLPRISGQERIWLHWGMAALAYPFFRDLAEVIGRMLTLQDDFTTIQVQSRLTPMWGDRNTSKEAAQKLITSMVDFGVLRKIKGRFRLDRKLMTTSPPSFSFGWSKRCLRPTPRTRLKCTSFCDCRRCSRSPLLLVSATCENTKGSTSTGRGSTWIWLPSAERVRSHPQGRQRHGGRARRLNSRRHHNLMKKSRNEISIETAAQILFESDRTCCICRQRKRPIQIHHLDDDPSNNAPENLACLCFDCHRDTQIQGGFDRKLVLLC